VLVGTPQYKVKVQPPPASKQQSSAQFTTCKQVVPPATQILIDMQHASCIMI